MHSVRRVHRTAEQEAARREKEGREIVIYRKLDAHVQSLRSNNVHNEAALKHNKSLLELNPEYSTMWNYRREIISEFSPLDQKEVLKADLALIESLFRKFPKVYWIWNHRRWCLSKLDDIEVWKKELYLVAALLNMDARNFHGWQYRREVIKRLEEMTGESHTKAEIEYTTAKINQNYSNYSAFHNRLVYLSKETPTAEILQSELNYVKQAVNTDPHDQSAWHFYRWLMVSDHWRQFRTPELVSKELSEMEELSDDEPDAIQCIHTILLLSKIAGNERTELRQVLAKMDPLRANRYLKC